MAYVKTRVRIDGPNQWNTAYLRTPEFDEAINDTMADDTSGFETLGRSVARELFVVDSEPTIIRSLAESLGVDQKPTIPKFAVSAYLQGVEDEITLTTGELHE